MSTYEITCTRCSGRVLVVDREWVLLVGKRPVELSTGLNVWIGVAEGPH